MSNESNIQFFVLIAERKRREALLQEICKFGGRVINSVYARGSVKASAFQDAFSFVPDENKVMICCLMPKENVDAAFNALTEKYHFDMPNTGIAFTVPLMGLSY